MRQTVRRVPVPRSAAVLGFLVAALFLSSDAFAETLIAKRRSSGLPPSADAPSPMYRAKSTRAKTQKRSAASIESFSLIDARSGKTLTPLKPGIAIDLARLPARELAVQAEGSREVTKIVFSLNARAIMATATEEPFRIPLSGSTPWHPEIGTNDIAATAYANGTQGATKSLRFRVFDSAQETTKSEPQSRSTGMDELAADTGTRAMLAPPSLEPPAMDAVKPRAKPQALRRNPIDEETLVPTSFRQSTSPEKTQARCVAVLNKVLSQLMVVCSHEMKNARQAQVLVSSLEGRSLPICEFPNTLSPMVASCVVNDEIATALTEGSLLVSVHNSSGATLSFPVERE